MTNIHEESPRPIAARRAASRFSRSSVIVVVVSIVVALTGMIVLYVTLMPQGPTTPIPGVSRPPSTASGVRAADTYVHPSGKFEKQGQVWIEYVSSKLGAHAKFKEVRRDDQYIYLYDETRYKDNTPTMGMYLRLPINGGIVQWSYPNPLVWTDLYVVEPEYR